jgi:hypothetical protein
MMPVDQRAGSHDVRGTFLLLLFVLSLVERQNEQQV